MNIGIFDSGIGGLSVLKELLRLLPTYNYVYLGDKAHVPYGGKSEKEIYYLVQNAVDFLFRHNCKLIVLACNTATSVALRRIQREYLPRFYPERRVLGVILPVIEEVVSVRIGQRIGILATQATVRSGSFVRELAKIDKNIQVFQQACPRLVPLIERGHIVWKGMEDLLRLYLAPLLKKRINGLILGCTHYAVVAKKIQDMVGPTIRVFVPGLIVAHKLSFYLARHPEIRKKLSTASSRHYFFTKLSPSYKNLVRLFLGPYINSATKLEEVYF